MNVLINFACVGDTMEVTIGDRNGRFVIPENQISMLWEELPACDPTAEKQAESWVLGPLTALTETSELLTKWGFPVGDCISEELLECYRQWLNKAISEQ